MEISELSQKRYEQLMERFGNDKEAVQDAIEDWDPEDIEKGYAVMNYGGTGMLQVQCVDSIGVFEDDCHAIDQAKLDGIRFIPEEELPGTMPDMLRHDGWIDTEANRAAIEAWCKRYAENHEG